MMRTPAFQMYPQDWLVKTNCMHGKTKGFFLVLLLILWVGDDQNSMENDPELISLELGCTPDEWEDLKKIAIKKGLLKETEDNRIFSPDLVEILSRQEERREKLKENGAKGGRPKNQTKPIGFEKKPNETLSSSSSSSSSEEEEELLEKNINPSLLPPKLERRTEDGLFFEIDLHGQSMTEDQWIYRNIIEHRRSKGLKSQGGDDLPSLLALYPAHMSEYRRWVTLPMAKRIAAFAMTALEYTPDNQLRYALSVAVKENNPKFSQYLQQAEDQVGKKDYLVRING